MQRGFGQDGIWTRALKDQGRAVVLMPDQMNNARPHDVNEPDGITQMKYRCSRRELDLAAFQTVEQGN